MRNYPTKSSALIAGLLALSLSAWAHHGTALSYDTTHVWSTWATIVEFNYINPHPSLVFERTDKNGNVERWLAEGSNNPSQLARAGWTKSRSVEALKPGTRVKLYVATARAGGFVGVVMKIENEKGENLVGERTDLTAVDMEGVPGGYQPSRDGK